MFGVHGEIRETKHGTQVQYRQCSVVQRSAVIQRTTLTSIGVNFLVGCTSGGACDWQRARSMSRSRSWWTLRFGLVQVEAPMLEPSCVHTTAYHGHLTSWPPTSVLVDPRATQGPPRATALAASGGLRRAIVMESLFPIVACSMPPKCCHCEMATRPLESRQSCLCTAPFNRRPN